MPAPLSGPGLGLAFPQNLYPSQLQNAPQDPSSNHLALAPGDVFVIPAGTFYVSLGDYLVLQFIDPVTATWQIAATGGTWSGPYQYVKSDGFNVRIANLTGCPIGAAVTNAGSGYAQASTTAVVTSGGGGALWTPIIGGALTGNTTVSVGAGYGVPPIVMIPPPPGPANNANGVGGRQAVAYAVIASGTVSAISFVDQGCGYPVPPSVVIVPSPFDPNLNTGITSASYSVTLTGSGSLLGILLNNPGNALPAASFTVYSVSIAGVGTNASVSVAILQCVTTASVQLPGVGYASPLGVTSSGGGYPTGTIGASAENRNIFFRPRPLQATFAAQTAGAPAVIIDGGLFASTPNIQTMLPNGSAVLSSVTLASISVLMSSQPDIAVIQPAP